MRLYLVIAVLFLSGVCFGERLELVTSVPLVRARQVDFQGDMAWVAQNMDGATLLDIADPSTPKVVKQFPPEDMMPMMFRALPAENLLLSADRFLGLVAYDVTIPDAPTTVSLTPLPGGMTTHFDLASTTDGLRFAILARAGEGIICVDITDAAAPRITDRFTTGIDFTRAVAVADGLVYAADSTDGGLKVLRIVSPGKLEPLYQANFFGSCDSLMVNGRYLVAGYRNRGLRAFELPDVKETPLQSTPTLRLLSSTLRNRSNVRAMATYKDFLVAANDTVGVDLFDTKNLALPVLSDEFLFKTDGLLAQSCNVYRDTIYVPAWDAGLLIFRVTDAPEPDHFNLENVDYVGSNQQ